MCLEHAGANSETLKRIEYTMKRIINTREHNNTTEEDTEARGTGMPFWLSDHLAHTAAYARGGTSSRALGQEAAIRKLALVVHRQCGGRGGEVAGLCVENLEYNAQYQCDFIRVFQFKLAEHKLISLHASMNRHVCWYLNYGDFMACGGLKRPADGEPTHLFQDLKDLQKPADALTNWIRAVLPAGQKGNVQRWNSWAVTHRHEDVISYTSHDSRTAIANELSTRMPAYFVAVRTGHVLSIGALETYLKALYATSMPSGRVVVGANPPPWGQLCTGVIPPSLGPLIAAGVPEAQLEFLIDAFAFIDSSSPLPYQRGGRMRGSIRHVIAAQIMWFQERSAAREMRFVLLHLQESYARAGLESAREILLHSQLIHDQFQLDNANDLTMGVHTAGSAMTAGTVLEALGTRIGSQEQLITTLSSQVMALTAQITKLSQTVLQTQQTLNQGAAGVDGAAGAGAVDVGSTAGVGGAAGVGEASGVTGAAGATGTPSHPQMPAELKNFDFKDKAGDTDAQEAYINIMERKGAVPIAGLSQPRVTEYNHLRDMFNAVATSLERNFMLNTKNELGERKKKAQEIQDRLKNKFKDALRPHIDSRGPKAVQGALMKMPPSLSRTHMIVGIQ